MSNPPDIFAPQPRPPEKSSNTCLILGLVFGGFGGFILLCGGCCFGTMYFAFGELEQQTRATLTDNEVIKDHIGQIQTFEIDSMASIQKSAAGEEDTFVFHATGDKGSGTIEAVVLDAGDGFYVESGQLKMSTGEVYELIEGTESPAETEPMTEEAPGSPEAPAASAADDQFVVKVQAALSGNAVLAESVGDIQSFKYDIVQSTNEPGDNVYVFLVTGSKASGKLRAECITDTPQTESVSSAELILDDGQSVQLFPDMPLP